MIMESELRELDHEHIASATATKCVEKGTKNLAVYSENILESLVVKRLKEAEAFPLVLVVIRPIMLHRSTILSERHGISAYSLEFTEFIWLSVEEVKMAQLIKVHQ